MLMEDLESNKNERRRILVTLQDWNIGITPHGNLATESCFVEIYAVSIIVFLLLLNTKSERANLVQSSASNSCDTETIKSLSIFHHQPSSKTLEKGLKTTHLIVYNVKASVIVDNIARLTKEFDNELSKAEEHWSHNPQKSWDKLCLIWNMYGFLWPQRVQIGFRIHESVEKDQRLDIISIKNHLEKESQGVLHSPKNYSVIWKTKLRPMHEFFPAQYNKKRDFINNMLHQFSILVFNDSLFQLKNVTSGDYLGRQSLDSSSLGVTVISSSNIKLLNNSNTFWKFSNHTTLFNMNHPPPLVFIGNEKYLCSGQYDTADMIVLSKSQQQQQQQHNLFDKNMPQFCADIKMVKHKQSTLSYDMNENCKWSIGRPITALITHSVEKDIFDLDNAINNHLCLASGDEIASSHYPSSLNPVNNSSSFTMETRGIMAKSPISVTSFGDQYNFSSGEMSESNCTQATSASNSFFSPTPAQKHNRNRNYDSSRSINQSSQNAPVFMERLSQRDQTNVYRWKIEMASKSIVHDQQQQNDIIQNPSIKSNTSKKDHFPKNYQKSKWLDVDPKLFNLSKDSEENEVLQQSIRTIQYDTPMKSIRSIPLSFEESFLPEMSKKKLGKLPLQDFQLSKYKNNHPSSDSDTWNSSRSSSPIDENDNLKIATNTSSSPILTKAETFKRGIQQTYKELENKNNIHNTILKNIFAPSPRSNITSQIKYYDDDGDNEDEEGRNNDANTEILGQGGSSQVCTYYTMTPRSRYSQPTTPSSSASLTPEEDMKRRRSREDSFMLLLNKETKRQLWLRAMKQSTLNHWLQVISTNTKKVHQNITMQANNINPNSSDTRIFNCDKIVQKRRDSITVIEDNME